ncbi:sulfite exporter TauE/SafE family protein [Celerinatantimonas yamalensis]|uniref:Probable membrane transporter protein n=1 Tax=Celerinatantimonas yamalensis TaxID=559956 RepID=A0ABW9G313_9GAMM
MPSPLMLVLAFGVVILGASVQSLIGFGLAVVAAPLLYFIDPSLVPTPLLLLGFAISAINWFHNRNYADFKSMGGALVMRIPGALIGLWLLLHFDAKGLQILIAIAVLMGVATTLTKRALRFNQRNLLIAGFISGLFATVAGIGGPPMAVLMRAQQANAIRGNLSAFFSVSSLISIFILGIGGQVHVHHLISTLILLPAVFIGFFLSKNIINKFDRKQITCTTQIVCCLSAVTLIYQALS